MYEFFDPFRGFCFSIAPFIILWSNLYRDTVQLFIILLVSPILMSSSSFVFFSVQLPSIRLQHYILKAKYLFFRFINNPCLSSIQSNTPNQSLIKSFFYCFVYFSRDKYIIFLYERGFSLSNSLFYFIGTSIIRFN